MAIEFNCTQCNKQLRVSDAKAGKKGKCPKCNGVVKIPDMTTAFDVLPDFSMPEAAPILPVKKPAEKKKSPAKRKEAPKRPNVPHSKSSAKAPAKPSAKPQQPKSSNKYFVATDFGQTYGPVTRNELLDWVEDGRITSGYVIRKENEKSGVYAGAMFPELGPIPTTEKKQKRGAAIQPIKYIPEPVQKIDTPIKATKLADPSNVIGYAWEIARPNFGLLFGASFVMLLPGLVLVALQQLVFDIGDQKSLFILGACTPFALLLSAFLSVGFTQLCLSLARGEQASFAQIFFGGKRFFPYLVTSVPFTFALAMGTALFVLPGLAVFVLFWIANFLAIDGKENVTSGLSSALEIGKLNYVGTLVLLAATGGMTFFGLLTCGVGLLLTTPFIWLMWTTAYLMMTGQVSENYRKVNIPRLPGV